MADVVWNETEGQVQDRLRAQVARLEGELAEAQTKYDRLLFTHDEVTLPMLYEADERLKVLEADKAALAAAVDEAAGLLGEEYLRTRNLTVGSVAVGLRAALSPDAGKGWVVAKGACNEHPDGCPEGSHRLSPYEAPQPQSRSEERRYRIQGWLPPEVREQATKALGDCIGLLEGYGSTGLITCPDLTEHRATLDVLKEVE